MNSQQKPKMRTVEVENSDGEIMLVEEPEEEIEELEEQENV